MQRETAAMLVVAAVVVLSGCGTLAELAEEGEVGQGPSDAYNVTVVDVVDGDTVDVRFANGTTDTARLIGVDTPEVHVENDPDEFGVPDTAAGRECLRAAGHDATNFTAKQVGGEDVTIRFDPNLDRRGGYDRLLVYVVDDGQNLNYDLLAEGHARVYENDFTERDRFDEAAADARANDTGLWACQDDPAAAAG